MKRRIKRRILSSVLVFNLIISTFIILNTSFSENHLYVDEKDHVIESTKANC